MGRGGKRHARAFSAGEKRRLRPTPAALPMAPPPSGAEKVPPGAGAAQSPAARAARRGNDAPARIKALRGGKILVVVFIEQPGSGSGAGRFSIA